MTEYPKSRKEAQAIGAKFYFTGEPCKHGHIALRKTKGTCVTCAQIEWKANAAKRADYFAAYNKSDAGVKAKQEYYERNKDTVKARAASRPIEDKRRYKDKYKQANPEYFNVLNNLRKRRHKNATPPWLSYFQKQEMRALYQQAATITKVTGQRYVVDHIVPLNGVDVCGLHVPWNLRVITQEENLKKSNKLVE